MSTLIPTTELQYVVNRFNLNLSGAKMPIEIPNTNRETLARLFAELRYGLGVEVGVERGKYSRVLLESNPGLKLWLVDPWQAYKGYREHVSQEKLDGFLEQTKEYLSSFNYAIKRKFSVDAAKDFEDNSLDFVYLDGNHEFRHVVDDISEWYPKVRIGGILAGHDYIRRTNPEYLMGVVEAIQGYTGAYRISPWFVLGRKEKYPGELRDDARTWFIVKQKDYKGLIMK